MNFTHFSVTVNPDPEVHSRLSLWRRDFTAVAGFFRRYRQPPKIQPCVGQNKRSCVEANCIDWNLGCAADKVNVQVDPLWVSLNMNSGVAREVHERVAFLNMRTCMLKPCGRHMR